MAEIFVGKVDELRDRVRIVTVGTKEVGVFHHNGAFYAYQNVCPHQGGPACEGVRLCQVVDVVAADRTYVGQEFDESDPHIVCPWHGWEFKLLTGEHAADADIRLKRYDVAQRDGDVYVVI